jgi:hypothetical protein
VVTRNTVTLKLKGWNIRAIRRLLLGNGSINTYHDDGEQFDIVGTVIKDVFRAVRASLIQEELRQSRETVKFRRLS